MKRKEQYADEIIEMLERTKCGSWASNINLNTKDRVIEVCQNVVDSWSGRKFKDHCTTSPQTTGRWIPVSERLPEAGEYIGDVAKYYLVQNEYGDMLVARYTHGEYWEQVYQLKPIGDEIVAWMPLPPCYEPQESEVQMQIMINISKDDYRKVQDGRASVSMMRKAIGNGTQLPKGHGRLVDEKDLSLMTVHLIDGIFVCNAPTIIEADKTESED